MLVHLLLHLWALELKLKALEGIMDLLEDPYQTLLNTFHLPGLSGVHFKDGQGFIKGLSTSIKAET